MLWQGILPIAQNEAGLATILGHEIAHYTLRHIAEQTSRQFFALIGVPVFVLLGIPLDFYFSLQHFGLKLPNSRACETEGPLPLKWVFMFSGLHRIALYGKGFNLRWVIR
jgi:metalloendopeptidase OMA1, mitochondrial